MTILLVLVAANVSAAWTPGSGLGLARAGPFLSLLRLVGLLTAAVILAVTLGISPVVGLADTVILALAVLEALSTILVAGVTLRRIRVQDQSTALR